MTRIRTSLLSAASAAVLMVTTAGGAGAALDLQSFAILGATTITNTGATTIIGNIGLDPGPAVTGFGSLTQTGSLYVDTAESSTAQTDLINLFNTQNAVASTHDLTGHDLGGLTLTAGVYNFDSSAQLTGTLILDAENNPNAVFIIQIGSTLTTASGSAVVLVNGALGKNVYFVVGSSATLGTGTTFAGQILALASITLNTDATIDCGAAWAHTGAVTLDSNGIIAPDATVCTVANGTLASVLGPTATENERAIANVLDVLLAAGTLPGTLATLLDLTPDELAAALDQLSGEGATAVAPSATEGMNSFLSTLFDNAFHDDTQAPQQGPSTVRALGYASERVASSGPVEALAPLDPSFAPGRWGVWAAGYGGYSTTQGDATIGSHNTSATTFGISAGFDQQVTAATTVGVALGGGRTNFAVADSLGSGSDSMLQAALYARTNLGRAYIAGAVAYSYNDITTERDIDLPTTPTHTTDHFSAAFAGNDVAGQVEVGYRLKWLIPYAAVRAQAFFSPAYSETATGTSGLGLSYAAQTTTALRTELGVRVAHAFPLADRARLTLTGRAAWAHDYGAASPMTAAFQSIPGDTFMVQGAAAARDSVLLSAGAELGFRNGWALAALFDSAFSTDSQMYSGTGRVSYRW